MDGIFEWGRRSDAQRWVSLSNRATLRLCRSTSRHGRGGVGAQDCKGSEADGEEILGRGWNENGCVGDGRRRTLPVAGMASRDGNGGECAYRLHLSDDVASSQLQVLLCTRTSNGMTLWREDAARAWDSDSDGA